MAAAEYYASGALPPASQFLAPPPAHPARASSTPGYGQGQYYSQPSSNTQTPPYAPGPPPYHQIDPSKPSQHSYPPPQRNSFSYPQRPDPATWNNQGYPPGPPAAPYQHANFPPRPQNYNPNQHLRPPGSDVSQGYISDPEDHRHRRHSHSNQKQRSRSRSGGATRSSNTDGLIGATGGGLIGDLIFPGLGTVGGALAGWVGGKDYGNRRKRRETEQRVWEEKFGNGHRHNGGHRHSSSAGSDDSGRRRRSSSHDRRDRSRDRGRSGSHDGRNHSHERRRSDR